MGHKFKRSRKFMSRAYNKRVFYFTELRYVILKKGLYNNQLYKNQEKSIFEGVGKIYTYLTTT